MDSPTPAVISPMSTTTIMTSMKVKPYLVRHAVIPLPDVVLGSLLVTLGLVEVVNRLKSEVEQIDRVIARVITFLERHAV